MSTLNINPNTFVVQTAAEWAADAIIYSERTLLVTSDQTFTGTNFRKIKLANGNNAWSALDYLPIDLIIALGVSLQNQINSLGLTEILAVNNVSGGNPIRLSLTDSIQSENAAGGIMNFGAGGNEFNVFSSGGSGAAWYLALLNQDLSMGYGANNYWWIKDAFLELAHDTLLQLSAPNVNMPNETASLILSLDGSKNIKGLPTATYPSLAELAHVKGLASSVQTQLDNKVSDLMFTHSATWNPGDSVTLYVGSGYDTTPQASALTVGIPLGTGTIVKADIYTRVGGTLGSNENVTLNFRLNNTTNTLLTSTLQLSAVSQVVSVTGLNITTTDTDHGAIEVITPPWATNPTTVKIVVVLFIKRT